MHGVVVHSVYKPPKEKFVLPALGHESLPHIVIGCVSSHSTTWGIQKRGYNTDLIFVSESIANMCEKEVMEPIPVVVVCHGQVRPQVSKGSRCRGSYTYGFIPPASAIDPLVTSQSGVRFKRTSVSRHVLCEAPQSVQMSLGSPNTLCL